LFLAVGCRRVTIEQFNVQTSMPDGLYIIVGAFLVIGAILLATYALLYCQLKHRPVFGGKIVGVGIGLNSKYGLAMLGITLIVMGGFVYGVGVADVVTPSIVTIGDGYINVESTNFVSHPLGLPFSKGSKNVTSEEIATAFVGQVGSGDFTLHKNSGTNFGDTNSGRYTLGNGAIAYVATTNSTCLIIEIKTGEYLIVGNQATQTLATSFSQNVHDLLRL
jgi:hypothetical protein